VASEWRPLFQVASIRFKPTSTARQPVSAQADSGSTGTSQQSDGLRQQKLTANSFQISSDFEFFFEKMSKFYWKNKKNVKN
jgi:hypothetical protein